jgi:hypothetical protein
MAWRNRVKFLNEIHQSQVRCLRLYRVFAIVNNNIKTSIDPEHFSLGKNVWAVTNYPYKSWIKHFRSVSLLTISVEILQKEFSIEVYS